MRMRGLVLAGLVLGAPQALAESPSGDGAGGAQTVLNLSANGSDSVVPDRIVATLDAQASSKDAAHAQAEVNKAMTQALNAARAVAGVTANTGGYSVYQTTPDGSHQPIYQASQNLQLSMAAPGGTPPAAFTNLVGALQQNGLLLNGLDGDLSTKGREAAGQGAIQDAIRQIDAQAKDVADSLDERVGRIQTLNVNLNLSGPGPVPRPVMMMAAKAAPPEAVPPKVTVQADVSATILLMPRS